MNVPEARPERRRIRDGDAFTSDELERGDIELEKPEPRPEPPPEQQDEPWARLSDLSNGKRRKHRILLWAEKRLRHGPE